MQNTRISSLFSRISQRWCALRDYYAAPLGITKAGKAILMTELDRASKKVFK